MIRIRLLQDCKFGRKGRLIDTPFEGMANVLIKRGIAVEEPVQPPEKVTRKRRTEKATSHV